MVSCAAFNPRTHLREDLRASSGQWRENKIFLFDIGLFQGCVLCVFQLLLDLRAPLKPNNGYHFKDIAIVLHDRAFADDISITSSTRKVAGEDQAELLGTTEILEDACQGLATHLEAR